RMFNAGACLLRTTGSARDEDLPRAAPLPRLITVIPAAVLIALLFAGLLAIGSHGTPLRPRLIDVRNGTQHLTSSVFAGWPTARYYTFRSRGIIDYAADGDVDSHISSSEYDKAYRFLAVGDVPITVVGTLPLRSAIAKRAYTIHAHVIAPRVTSS